MFDFVMHFTSTIYNYYQYLQGISIEYTYLSTYSAYRNNNTKAEAVTVCIHFKPLRKYIL